MRNVMLVSLVGVLIAGCASFQTEILEDPGRVDSLTVGQFITANPVDNELIGSYLRKELSKRGFQVVDDSPYTLSGVIAIHPYYSTVEDARIILKKDYTDQVIWSFQEFADVFPKLSRKDFARYMAGKIGKRLR